MSLPRTVEIIAHRGASRDCLENTLSAFRTALAQRADGIELDVHATRDRVVVVHHDPVVKVRAVSGRGADPREPSSVYEPPEEPGVTHEVAIADVTYAELCTHTLANGEHIPTLDEVLVLAEGKATVYVEVKGVAIEENVLECLSRHPNTTTAVHSFDHRIPHAIGQLDRRVPLGILSSSYLLDIGHMITSAGARDLWQHTALVDQALVHAARAAGARVVVWTENNFEHAAELVQMGVDAICTDVPGAMRDALRAAGRTTGPEHRPAA